MKSLLFAALVSLLPAACDKVPSYTIPFLDVSHHVRTTCPAPSDSIVILTGGQSNAGNHLSTPSPPDPHAGVYVFYDGDCYDAQDPMPGASGNRGSLWPELGRRLAHATGKSVLFISAARGGASYSDWLSASTGYMRDMTIQVELAVSQGYIINWIIWHQGETDARAQENPARTQQELGALMDHLLRLAPQGRIYLFRASRCNDKTNIDGVAGLRDTQTRVARERRPRILPGMNTDTLGDDYRMDRCHFNTFARDIITDQVSRDLLAAMKKR